MRPRGTYSWRQVACALNLCSALLTEYLEIAQTEVDSMLATVGQCVTGGNGIQREPVFSMAC